MHNPVRLDYRIKKAPRTIRALCNLAHISASPTAEYTHGKASRKNKMPLSGVLLNICAQHSVVDDYISIDICVVKHYTKAMKEITYTSAARKALRKMPANTAQRIMGKIDAYAADPKSQANNVKALKGQDAIRLRVADWRVIMIDGVVIEVIKIAPRGGAY